MDNAADFALCGFISVEGVIFFALFLIMDAAPRLNPEHENT